MAEAIDSTQFSALVARYLASLDGGPDVLTAADYETMVRLWNTIKWHRPDRDEDLLAAFEARFFPHEVATVVSALQMTPSKGMALYSRERDLYLGGAPHDNSMYEVQPA